MDIQFGFQSFSSGSIPPSPTPPDPIPLTYAEVATINKLSYIPAYYNGPSNDGVGATLTATQNGYISDGTAVGKIDYNYIAQVGDIILVKNEVSKLRNGLYQVVDTGSSTTPYQLVRSPENDTSAELYPLQVNVLFGQTQNLRFYIQTTVNPTVGTSNIVFSLSVSSSYTAPLTFVDTATSSALPECTYASGTNVSFPGLGATLTATNVGALGTINGLSATTNTSLTTGFTKILVKNQVNEAHNGTYLVTSAGNSTTRWKLTRIDYTSGGFNRYIRYFLVSNTGSTLAGKYYFTVPTNPPLTNATIGTANLQILEYGGGAGGYNLIQEEGTSLPARTTIDFQGAGVTATDDGTKTIVTIPGGGSSIVGENYVVVYAGDDWVANGIELANALATAEGLTPNGASISATNRVTIICYPGYYDVAGTLVFRAVTDEYIDLVSITGNCDVNLVEISGSPTGQPLIVNSADNNFVGINCGTGAFVIDSGDDSFVNCKNCKGGDNSFGSTVLATASFTLMGTFENCIGGNYSFSGGNSNKSIFLNTEATYINCTAIDYSFGVDGSIAGTFINCTSGNYSFGYNIIGDFTATFENCKGEDNCFGNFNLVDSETSSVAISNMTNCIAGNSSFFVNSYRSSTIIFRNCVGENHCFNNNIGVVDSMVNNNEHYSCVGNDDCFGRYTRGYENINYYNCIANDNSFQHTGNAHYYACVGNDYCFQDPSGISNGIFCQDCVANDYSFGYVECQGFQYQNCSANEYSFGANTGICASIYLKYCSANANSFGSPSGTLNGKLHWCYLRDTTFATVSGVGRTFYCVGNNTPNNQ